MQLTRFCSVACEIFGCVDSDGVAAVGGAAEVVTGAAGGEEPPQPATLLTVPAPRLAVSNMDIAKRRLANMVLLEWHH